MGRPNTKGRSIEKSKVWMEEKIEGNIKLVRNFDQQIQGNQ